MTEKQPPAAGSFAAQWGFTIPSSFLAAIREARTVVLMTHRGPDGDGLGSQAALIAAFDGMGKQVSVLNCDKVPPRYRFLDPEGRLGLYSSSDQSSICDADLALLVDTAEPGRAGTPARVRLKAARPLLAIDHHPRNAKGVDGFIAGDSSSTAEMVFVLLKELGCPITQRIAEALFAGIAFDTHSFRFIRNNGRPLRIANELLEAGADAEKIQNELFRHPPDLLALLGRLLPQFAVTAEGRVAVLVATKAHLAGLSLDSDEIGEVVNLINSLRGVRVCAFARQRGRRSWRVNLRSQAGYPINGVAREWGGGGHENAAGATLEGLTAEAVQAKLEKALAEIASSRSTAPREESS